MSPRLRNNGGFATVGFLPIVENDPTKVSDNPTWGRLPSTSYLQTAFIGDVKLTAIRKDVQNSSAIYKCKGHSSGTTNCRMSVRVAISKLLPSNKDIYEIQIAKNYGEHGANCRNKIQFQVKDEYKELPQE